MHKQLIRLALGLCLGAAAGAGAAAGNKALARPQEAPLTPASYEAARKTIDRQFAADRKACARLRGHASEVCQAQAEGRQQAEKARLEARHDPSPEKVEASKFAIAQANFQVAMEKCDGHQGKARSRCRQEARAAREAAERQARVEKVRATGGIFGEDKPAPPAARKS